MMKKLSLLAVLVCAALTLTACVPTDIGEYYQTAQLYLGRGDFDSAADLFVQLGEYADSAEYALYCRALQAIKDGDYALARADLTAIEPFKSSGRYLLWLDALEAENEGDLEAALALYEQLGSFCDAHLEAERLRTAIPEAAIKEGRALMAKGEYAAARELFLSLDGYGASETLANSCTTALNKAAYNAAEDLAESGDLLGAMAAFTAMGDTLDAAKRAEEIRSDMLASLEEQYAVVTLATAPDLISAYAELGTDETAQARIAELTERFGKNLTLITMQDALVQLGSYPQAESGEEQPILWRVIKAEGSVLTLLSESVLDAACEAQSIALTFNDAELAALGEPALPSMADLAVCGDLRCTATPYALAQGAENLDGAASYWLRDSLENGLHPIIAASGTMSLPQEGAAIGVRPIVTLDVEKFTFTKGDGTQGNPFN